MQDKYLREHFDRRGRSGSGISDDERRRVAATLALTPLAWRSVVDVGCGDGRATNGLLERQVNLYGMDWASRRLDRFRGKAIVADIRSPWPVNFRFDGAILAEVLEHLVEVEIGAVLNNIRRFVKAGFVVSVPANEVLLANSVMCQACKREYHIWGHQHSFGSFDQVDKLVGQVAVARSFVRFRGTARSGLIARTRRSLGLYPHEPGLICPFCGVELAPPPGRSLPMSLISKALTVIELVSAFRRPAPGWFICRYDIE